MFLITVLKDDDSDGILDVWEESFTGNITDLNCDITSRKGRCAHS